MAKVRVGIMGAGWVVRQRHLPAFRQIQEVEVKLIWSRSPEKARALATEFGITAIASHWQEIVDSREVDAVVVGTPPVLHMPATLAALGAGKHVLCQARMARNLHEAQAMARAASESSLVTGLYPARPGLKGDRVMRRLLHDENLVGKIREVRVTGMEWREKKEGYEWAADPDVAGVNAMALGMWAEVLNRWVGPARRLMALGRSHDESRISREGQRAEATIPDSLAVVAELACGATASYHFASRAAATPGHAIEIYGSEGALVYQLFVEEIRGAAGNSGPLQPIAIPPEEERLQDTDAQFIRAIREGSPVSPDFEEGLRYMEFCEAVAHSVARGTAVAVPPEAVMNTWGSFRSTKINLAKGN